MTVVRKPQKPYVERQRIMKARARAWWIENVGNKQTETERRLASLRELTEAEPTK
jgi:hypothetical protein